MNIVIDQPNQIRAFQIAAQISAIKLEGKGLKSRGGSILAKCKKYYGLKGSREKVIAEMQKIKQFMLDDT